MKVTRILVVEFVLCSIYIGYANSEDAATVSELFARNMKSKCTVSDSNNDCKNERDLGKESKENGAVMFGPRFQKVHLELPRINPVRTGYSRRIKVIEGEVHEMKTLSIHPPIFEIKNFLSEDECDAIVQLAKEKGMKQPTAAIKNLNLPKGNDHSAFDKWDKNLDGSLSNEEVSAIEEIKHLLLTDEDIAQMYQDLGLIPDKSGLISYGKLKELTFAKFRGYLEMLDEKKANISVHQTEETWLWHDEDELLVYEDVLQNYHQRLSNLTRIPTSIIQESEPLLVTKFKNGSFTECRHDSAQIYPNIPCCVFGLTSKCRVCRFISIMYFLNDVPDGELLFPLANNKTYNWNDLHKHTSKVCSKTPNISLSNLAIKPEKGKAIMWYNHYIGRDTGWMSTIDPLSFYGTNKVEKVEKWVATTWINIIGDGVNELRPWRMGCNWLSENNKNKKIIESMRNDDFIEGEEYLHDAKLTALDGNDDYDDNIGGGGSLKDEVERIGKEVVNESKSVVQSKKIVEVKDETLKLRTKSETKSDLDYGREVSNENIIEKEAMSNKTSNEHEINSAMQRDESQETIHHQSSKTNKLKQNEANDEVFAKQEDVEKTPPKKRNRSPDNDEGPLGPPLRNLSPNSNKGPSLQSIRNELHYLLPSGKIVENKVVISILMLIEELSRDELEMVARTLHEKLQLACIPIMVNPIGPM